MHPLEQDQDQEDEIPRNQSGGNARETNSIDGEEIEAKVQFEVEVHRMNADLGVCVDVLREGVEVLALGEEAFLPPQPQEYGTARERSGSEGIGLKQKEEAEIWGMLEFALQDWR